MVKNKDGSSSILFEFSVSHIILNTNSTEIVNLSINSRYCFLIKTCTTDKYI